MNTTKQITQLELKELVTYCDKTGIMKWIINVPPRGYAGNEVGYTLNTGYRYVGMKGNGYLVHRLAWLYMHGCFPVNMIDHINRNTLDNRITNLRNATSQINQRNMKKMKHEENET